MMRNSLKETGYSNKDHENSTLGFKNMDHNESNSMMRMTSNTHDNFKVIIRVRPSLQREMEMELPFRSIVKIS
jgi:hypothetical protein